MASVATFDAMKEFMTDVKVTYSDSQLEFDWGNILLANDG